ncbi:Acyl-CoA N-acyltransferase [Akanthomyces lecanii RCEF 1005]|uniref:Acyl-CoA N-acyltransferase n=1 Tax=Akanthomyces lecanii RCEF 1005 TaxID=1081108 RepID=A0A162K8K8_CORDF|nr:Acyl-CoA N-acyltransferase [Akanthomyces lecanii RCEF 1005]
MAKVENAIPADVPTLGALQLNAFDSPEFLEMFPEPYTMAAWAGFVQRGALLQSGALAQSGLQTRVVLVRDEPGLPTAACLLHVAQDRDAAAEIYGPWQDRWGAPLPGMSTDKLDAFFVPMKTQHKAVLGDAPQIFLEVIMTHSTARRRGHGMALLQFVNAMADEMGLPLYLDADADAVSLYKRAGYVQQPDEVRTSEEFVPMLRAPVRA